ncbi:MAG: hypothetical protein V4683_17755, partial [Bacteroidota bacterium]
YSFAKVNVLPEPAEEEKTLNNSVDCIQILMEQNKQKKQGISLLFKKISKLYQKLNLAPIPF